MSYDFLMMTKPAFFLKTTIGFINKILAIHSKNSIFNFHPFIQLNTHRLT